MPLPEALDTSPCGHCSHATCCIRYRVVVSPWDVYRLATETSRSPLEFVFLHPDATGDVAMDASSERYLLCLAKRPTGGPEHPCALLGGEPGSYRCTVHSARPMVCRSFPLRPTKDGRFVTMGEPCPPVWSEGDVRQEGARRLHDLWRVERDLGAAFVERWNRIAASAPSGRSRSPRMLFFWTLDVFGRLDAVLRPWTSTPAGLDVLTTGWASPGGPWRPGVEAALGVLDEALVQARARDVKAVSR